MNTPKQLQAFYPYMFARIGFTQQDHANPRGHIHKTGGLEKNHFNPDLNVEI